MSSEQQSKVRVTVGYPTKSKSKTERQLEYTMNILEGTTGDLSTRNPKVVRRTHKDGSIWYLIEANDI